MQKSLYIGIMAGTSLDGVDVALVDFSVATPVLIAHLFKPYSDSLFRASKSLCEQQQLTFDQLGSLDGQLADFFSTIVSSLLNQSNTDPQQIIAIGSHGQTIQHNPNNQLPYTLQIGDPNRLAEKTGITVVADFRRRDVAAGGQGAPLVPAFHQAVFQQADETRAIVNIGGIANITILPANTNEPVIGFDCGPGNTLMNNWCQRHYNKPYDQGGQLAQSGTVNLELLQGMLKDPYFHRSPPKSTGPEYFSTQWLNSLLQKHPTSGIDTLSTLCELTAISISLGLENISKLEKVMICGGGCHNQWLMSRLQNYIKCSVTTTSHHGVDPDWVEAMAFAWLAKQTLEGKPGNIPSVTGANREVILGAIYPA